MPNERFMRHYYGASGYVPPKDKLTKAASDQGCINCHRRFGKHDVRWLWGGPDDQVGPFCERCSQTIKTHEAR